MTGKAPSTPRRQKWTIMSQNLVGTKPTKFGTWPTEEEAVASCERLNASPSAQWFHYWVKPPKAQKIEGFTPGPWKWVGYGGHHRLENDEGTWIHSDGSAGGEYSPDINVDGPDARLIAQAPAMYEALASRDRELSLAAIQNYDVHPFDAMTGAQASHVEHWLRSNEKSASDVKWSLYPIGMAQRWIECAEKVEGELSEMREALQDCKKALELALETITHPSGGLEPTIELPGLPGDVHRESAKGMKLFDERCDACAFTQIAEDVLCAVVRAERQKGEAVSKWIAVEDKLPQEYEYVIVYMPSAQRRHCEISYFDDGRWSLRTTTEVTHWMPLPDDPAVRTERVRGLTPEGK